MSQGFPTRLETKWAVQPQNMARSLNITNTFLCNILQIFTAVEMVIFS